MTLESCTVCGCETIMVVVGDDEDYFCPQCEAEEDE